MVYANSFFEWKKEVHDRMPSTLTKEEEKIWLNIDQKPDDLVQLLTRPNGMEMYKVSKEVGNVKNNYPEILNSF